jgi:Rrf2 family protein
MKLQKNTLLALYSVLEFAAHPGQHVPAAEVADKYRESPHHLAKVLSELARAGIVESVRGVGGGYRFVANARRLTLLDVIRLFEHLDAAAPPPGEIEPAERALAQVLQEVDQTTLATFGSISIATMLKMVQAAGL